MSMIWKCRLSRIVMFYHQYVCWLIEARWRKYASMIYVIIDSGNDVSPSERTITNEPLPKQITIYY